MMCALCVVRCSKPPEAVSLPVTNGCYVVLNANQTKRMVSLPGQPICCVERLPNKTNTVFRKIDDIHLLMHFAIDIEKNLLYSRFFYKYGVQRKDGFLYEFIPSSKSDEIKNRLMFVSHENLARCSGLYIVLPTLQFVFILSYHKLPIQRTRWLLFLQLIVIVVFFKI